MARNLNKKALPGWLKISIFAFLAISSVFFNPAFGLVFLAFPFVFFVSNNVAQNILLFVYGFFINLTYLVTVSALLSFSSIGISFNSVLSAFVALNLLVFWRLKQARKLTGHLLRGWEKPAPGSSIVLAAITLLVTAVGILHYLPAAQVLAPLTHDPEAHAYYTKIIRDTGQADYFYAPGLHIVSLLVSLAFGASLALSVHYATYFAIALAGLGIGVFVLWATRNKVLALVATVAYLCAPIPWLFPVTAGKNALVAAAAYLPFVLFSFYLAHKHKKRSFYIVFGLSLLSLGLLHYPTFAYGIGVPSVYLLMEALVATVKRRRLNRKNIFYFATSVVISALILFVWIKSNQSSFTELTLVNESGEISEANKLGAFSIPWNDLGSHTVRAATQVIDTYANQLTAFNHLFLYSFMAAGSVALTGFLSKRYRPYSMAVFSAVITFFAIPFTIRFIDSASLDTTADSGPLLTFLPLSILLALAAYMVLGELRKFRSLHKIAIVLVFALLAISLAYALEMRDRRQSHIYESTYSVRPPDLAAYEWINRNTAAGDKFIVDSYNNEKRPQVIFSQKGGLWLPVYTDAESSMPFEVHQFASKLSNDNFKLYETIKNKEPLAAQAALTFINNGYKYYYQSKSLDNDDEINVGFLSQLPGVQVKKVYENEQVAIYRLDAN